MRDDLELTVIIPCLAALVTGALSGALVLALAAWRGWAPVYALVAGSLAALLSWLVWSARFAALLEYQIAPDRQLDQSTQKDSPTVNLRIHREDEGGYLEGTFLDRLPVGDRALSNLARQVVAGQSLTTTAMTGSGLSRTQWEVLRDRFVSAGLLSWRSGNRAHGCEVTARGMLIFRRLADPESPTPPSVRMG